MDQQPTHARTVDRGRRALTGAVAATLAAPWVATRAQAKQVVVRTGGGGYDEAKRASVYEPFTRETGIEIVLVAANATKMLALARAGSSEIDVYDTNDETLLQLERANGLAPIGYGAFRFTDAADLDPVVRKPQFVGHSYFATLLGYNTKAFKPGSEPKSWAEFWDVKRFPGPRALPNPSLGEPALEFALLADGVPMDKLYPLDVERALRKLGEIRGSIVKFWEAGAMSVQLLIDAEATLVGLWNTRLYEARGKGAPVEAQWNRNQAALVAFGVNRHARNAAHAQTFVDYCLSAPTQTRWMQAVTAMPANRKAQAVASPTLRDPATGTLWVSSRGFMRDINWWADNRQRVAERWQRWVLG